MLNCLIDMEFEKNDDEIDFDFIDSCSNALVELHLGIPVSEILVPFVSSHSFLSKSGIIGRKSLNKGFRAMLIAAVILASTIAANATAQTLTGKTIIDSLTPGTEETTNQEETTTEEMSSNTEESFVNTTIMSKRDDSVFVSKSYPDSIPEGKYIFKVDDSASGTYNAGEIKSYSGKGSPFDNVKINYNYQYDYNFNCDASSFNEKAYMNEYYPNDVCYENNEESHKFSSWQITKEAGCGTLGEKKRTCTLCNYEQVCPIKATFRHKIVYDAPYASGSRNTPIELRATCTVCGVEGTFKVGYPKYLVLDNDTFYYEASNSQYPKIIAVLDSNGYEIPSKYWTEYHNVSNDEATKRNWIGVTFSGLYSHHLDICTFFNVYPPKINISAISSLNNGINVYWSKGSIKSTEIASGYQIQFSTSQDFSNASSVRVTGYLSTSRIIDGLKNDTTYYVRIRPYRSWSSSDSYLNGPWSDVRAVKTK